MSPNLPVLLLTMLGATCALGQDIITSDFSGSSPAENLPIITTTHLAPGLTTSGWILGAGAEPVTGIDDQLAFNIPATNAEEGTPLAEAIAENDYLALTLTPGAPIDLGGQRLSFTVERGSWFSPRQYSVFTSVAGFAEADELFRTPLLANIDVAPANSTFSFIFPLAGYDDLAAPIEIRIYPSRGRYNNHFASLAAFSITDPGPVFSVEADAEQGGTVTTNPASPLFTAGETVTLTAEPPAGFRFAGWQGTSPSDFNPLRIEVAQHESVTAQFVRNAPDQMGISTNLPRSPTGPPPPPSPTS